MVTCPKCRGGPDYKHQGWFVKHMIVKHSWTTSEAEEFWDIPSCPKCGMPVMNTLYCNSCGVLFKELVKNSEV